MKKLGLALLLALCIGCDANGPITKTSAGWVRANYGNGAGIIFEDEQGHMYRWEFCLSSYAPVWQGFHGIMEVQKHNTDSGVCYTVISTQHLPPDIEAK